MNIEHGAWFGSGRGIEVGDRSDIGMDALVMGPVTIGKDVMMGPRCILIASSHRTRSVTEPMNQQGFEPDKPIRIDDDVWLGANVTVLPGTVIGEGSVVGAGSVVAKNIPPWVVAVGNPAVAVRQRR